MVPAVAVTSALLAVETASSAVCLVDTNIKKRARSSSSSSSSGSSSTSNSQRTTRQANEKNKRRRRGRGRKVVFEQAAECCSNTGNTNSTTTSTTSRIQQRIHIVPRLQQASDAWYTMQDYSDFEQDVRTSIRLLRSSTTTTSTTTAATTTTESSSLSSTCSSLLAVEPRGLEKYKTVEDHQEKKLREGIHYTAVFAEQDKQRRDGIPNAARLGRISKQYSAWARERALRHAEPHGDIDGSSNVGSSDENEHDEMTASI